MKKFDVPPLMLISMIIVIVIIFIGLCNFYDIFLREPPPEYHVAPQGTLIATEFQNPFEGNGTTNGGGWIVNVTALSGPRVKWSTVIVALKEPSGMSIDSFDGVSEENSDIHSTKKGASLKWYLRKTGDPSFMDNGNRSSSFENLGEDEFETMENTSMLVVDKDLDDKLGPGDFVVVFKDHDADGVDDITKGAIIDFKISAGMIGSAYLTFT
jgi:hypothetical protein